MACQVIVCFEQNFKKPIDVCKREEQLKDIRVKFLADKIQELRPYIAARVVTAVAAATAVTMMSLIYKGKTLQETQTLAECGIKHKSEIHAVMRCDGGLELIIHDPAPL